MEHTPHIRRHLEDARRALLPVPALLQQLAIAADRAAEEPTPEAQAALVADLHRSLDTLAVGTDALLALRHRLESRADTGRERDARRGSEPVQGPQQGPRRRRRPGRHDDPQAGHEDPRTL